MDSSRRGSGSVAGKPDPKPVRDRRENPSSGGRIVDRHATLRKRLRERGCRLIGLEGCNGVAETGHHIVPKGAPHYGDDVVDNIAPACGSGTTGCHGKVENYDVKARSMLARKLLPEEWSYLVAKLGGVEAATGWLSRTYYITEEEIRDLYH